MSFVNKRLPLRLGAGLRISPTWKTRVTMLDNGREVRNREWLYPIWRAWGSLGAFTPDDRVAMRRWFVAMAGRHMAFRVRDPLDFTATDEVIAPSIGTSTPVQLLKTFAIDGLAGVSVLIQAPVDGSVTVYRNGSPVTCTVDDETGLVTPAAPWAAGDYTWSGQFDRWMRFDSDENAVQANALNAYTADIELVEVRR
jgi:uncharacterized protein (TIGR02217 family)